MQLNKMPADLWLMLRSQQRLRKEKDHTEMREIFIGVDDLLPYYGVKHPENIVQMLCVAQEFIKLMNFVP